MKWEGYERLRGWSDDSDVKIQSVRLGLKLLA
jgi:hypothetical protein